jgi:signal peptide peptidase SppA
MFIPVLTLDDVISNDFYKKQKKLIDDAFKNSDTKAIAVIINSPGGSPVQSELIYKRIRSLAKEKDVRILTFIEDVGASGGYMVALVGDEIYASACSIVGSIGVISSGFGLHEFIKRHGIERRVYAQGENKGLLDPFLPQREEDVEILNAVGKDVHTEFINLVKERRGDKLVCSPADLFTGKIWSGRKAAEIGLIDGIGDIHSVLESKYGKNIELKYITESKTLLGALRSGLGIIWSFVNYIQMYAGVGISMLMP